MKIAKQQIKIVSLMLSVLVVLQSCTVYKSSNYTFDQAEQQSTKTKIVYNNNEKVKFKKILKIDEQYFGVKRQDREFVKTLLDSKMVKELKVKNKFLSAVLTFEIPC